MQATDSPSIYGFPSPPLTSPFDLPSDQPCSYPPYSFIFSFVPRSTTTTYSAHPLHNGPSPPINNNQQRNMAPIPTPEPIPLRTLTTLLHYELMVSDPRLQNTHLIKSSFGDPTIVDRYRLNYAEQLRHEPASVQSVLLVSSSHSQKDTGEERRE